MATTRDALPPSARSVAYHRIREGIIRGDFPPGSLLSENELAGTFNVSRQPVREALLLVAQEGLVEVRPRSGTYVAGIDTERVREAQFIRETIEVGSLALCTQLSEAHIADLRSLIDEQRRAQDRESFYPLDERFHRALLAIAGHPNAWAAVGAAKAHLDRARYVAMSATRAVQDYVDDHEKVVDALAAGDIETAAACLRNHLRFVFADLNAVRAAHPELFQAASAPSRAGRGPRTTSERSTQSRS